MRKALILGAVVLLGAYTLPTIAAACTVVFTDAERTPAAQQRRAAEAVERAVVIVDAEVVRPYMRGQQKALLKAYRVHKGPLQATYEVDAPTSCNRAFEVVGERVRVLLSGGPEVYFDDDVGLARQVDRLLKSDRRKDWPYLAGLPAEATP
ncbi:MAG: hypothetical protein V4466_10775 [Pseudomonadota bacterium]